MTNPWRLVLDSGARLRNLHLRDLFAADRQRFRVFSRSVDGLLLDFSKEKIDHAALDGLLDLARHAGLESRREALFSGQIVNPTEGRAALHMALRDGVGDDVAVNGTRVMGAVRETRDRFLAFAEQVRDGTFSATDGPFTDVINIGIGGSDLGPAMACRALTPDAAGPRLHFVSNVDGAHLEDVTAGLDPRRTLLIIASKTFTTLETMTNARSAKAWLERGLGGAADRHLTAVSTNLEATAAFGISADRVFGFWDWVGGRYSLWSAIGLPIAIAVGAENFRRLLMGAANMDNHFRTAPLEDNLPVLLGLIGVWRRNVMGCQTTALIPYDQRLERFPAYVQQLEMESNGKTTSLVGGAVEHATAPVVWGEPGTNAQHSFFQLIHQGSDVVPVDFIAAARPRTGLADHHAQLLANCLAQSQALAFGKTVEDARVQMTSVGTTEADAQRLAPHRAFAGDRPSTTLLFPRLDPENLGRLVALYEHKIFVQSVVWNINPFDQWGVELGKQLAAALLAPLTGGNVPADLDASTAGLIKFIEACNDETA